MLWSIHGKYLHHQFPYLYSTKCIEFDLESKSGNSADTLHVSRFHFSILNSNINEQSNIFSCRYDHHCIAMGGRMDLFFSILEEAGSRQQTQPRGGWLYRRKI